MTVAGQKKKITFTHIIRKGFFLTLGAFIAGFAIECFLVPNKIIDGGVVGVSMILNNDIILLYHLLLNEDHLINIYNLLIFLVKLLFPAFSVILFF